MKLCVINLETFCDSNLYHCLIIIRTDEEAQLLQQVRERLADKFSRSAQYPEVVGDRKLIRFIRGHFHNLDKVISPIKGYVMVVIRL